MEILNLEGTEDTPKIILDKKNGIFEISGRSLPEDSAEFYRPVLEWIEKYSSDPNAAADPRCAFFPGRYQRHEDQLVFSRRR